MNKNDPPRKLTRLFMGIGLIFGIIVVSIFFQTLTLWKISQTWPVTTGIVTRTASKGWWDEERERRYYLEYEYTVGEKTYTNVQFHFKERSIKKYKYLIRKYKKGDPIPVWVNPESPDQAVINTAYPRDGFALLVVLTGFLMMMGTMILKETRWQRQTQALTAALPKDYQGDQPLPASGILTDSGGVVRLNTGMSIFWSFGIPFVCFSFLSLLFMMIFLNELNPGWSLLDYSSIMAGSWGASLVGGFLIKIGFRKTLEINADQKMITETSATFFKQTSRKYAFSDIQELLLERETWRKTNTLKNWILYLHTQSRQSIFVSFRHRDIQPSDEAYLGCVKQRLETLIFGAHP
ncbi:DUF3592 domain-containing protein [Desulfobacula sp.]|uniref:DUF3592 domain-containing protein n=1 Tax=Desulfobacula sp. TaxID=2593537 RepID=UPI00262E4FA4|nr:DUF3592 domain-containing protein [Desulfobacula sp.]